MKRHIKIIILAVTLASLAVLLQIATVIAQGRGLSLPWSVIGSGGMGGTAGSFTIHSTLGQPVAGVQESGTYQLTSGFWAQVREIISEFFNFLPMISR